MDNEETGTLDPKSWVRVPRDLACLNLSGQGTRCGLRTRTRTWVRPAEKHEQGADPKPGKPMFS